MSDARDPLNPFWLEKHRLAHHRPGRPSQWPPTVDSRISTEPAPSPIDRGFNSHRLNDGSHVSPYDEGRIDWGMDNLTVRLLQGVDEASLRRVLSRALRATTGVHPDEPEVEGDADEMFRGGLQAALESQTIVFEVVGASRALTHQLVRSRRAAFHQQSQRATWYGDRPNVRFPDSVRGLGDYGAHGQDVELMWRKALLAAWNAYSAACDAGMSYEEARYILPEGTTNYILCEYTIREFIAVFAYRGCSMFLWEMVQCMRSMRAVLLAAHPFLEPYVKISCEKTGEPCPCVCHRGASEHDQSLCKACAGSGRINRQCTFQGWENVEHACSFPWAKQDNRVFLPSPKYRIGA